MGKNIKSYATTPSPFPGKGREALRQKVLKIRYGLTVHIIRFYRQKSLIFRLKYGTA